MYINTDKMVSMTEANRNFSKVAKMVDDEKMVVIMKNNKPRYVMMDYGEFESIKSSAFRVKDENSHYDIKNITDNIEIVSETGEVHIPDSIIRKLGINRTITFIEDKNQVRLANTASYALEKIQQEMKGKAEKAGLNTTEDVVQLIKGIRKEMWED